MDPTGSVLHQLPTSVLALFVAILALALIALTARDPKTRTRQETSLLDWVAASTLAATMLWIAGASAYSMTSMWLQIPAGIAVAATLPWIVREYIRTARDDSKLSSLLSYILFSTLSIAVAGGVFFSSGSTPFNVLRSLPIATILAYMAVSIWDWYQSKKTPHDHDDV